MKLEIIRVNTSNIFLYLNKANLNYTINICNMYINVCEYIIILKKLVSNATLYKCLLFIHLCWPSCGLFKMIGVFISISIPNILKLTLFTLIINISGIVYVVYANTIFL